MSRSIARAAICGSKRVRREARKIWRLFPHLATLTVQGPTSSRTPFDLAELRDFSSANASPLHM
jgi:hypothetical protein